MKLQIKLKNKFKHFVAGFSLIELMVVVAIIGVLASIAVPSYQGYIGKARLTHLTQFADDVKKKVTEYHTMNGVFPTTTSSPAIATIISVPTDPYIFNTVIGAAFTGSGLTATATIPTVGKYTIIGKGTGIAGGTGGGEPMLQLTATYTAVLSNAAAKMEWTCVFASGTAIASADLIKAIPPECTPLTSGTLSP